MASQKRTKNRRNKSKNTKPLYIKVFLYILIIISILFLIYMGLFYLAQPPRPDAFYNIPDPLPSITPGTIIKTTKINTDVDNADVYKIMYVSRDQNNLPTAVTGTVFVPQATAPTTGRNLVAWAHGTSGIADQCAPSLLASKAVEHLPGVQQFINEGYIVTATDYQGLGTKGPHPYLIGNSEAHGVLDSIRAANSVPNSNFNNRYALWGHSQGGQSVIYSSQLAKSYAPELDLVASAAAAPATDLATLLKDDIQTEVGKVLGPMALKAWSEVYPEAEMSKIIKAEALPAANLIAEGCIETANSIEVLLPPTKELPQDFITQDPTVAQPWANIIADNSAKPSGISDPMYIGQGTADNVVNPAVTKAWAQNLCSVNNNVTFKSYPGLGHNTAGFVVVNDVIPWLSNIFSGQSATGNCGSY
jgi:alpha-beta hydrolase superfamily lysophospholipase